MDPNLAAADAKAMRYKALGVGFRESSWDRQCFCLTEGSEYCSFYQHARWLARAVEGLEPEAPHKLVEVPKGSGITCAHCGDELYQGQRAVAVVALGREAAATGALFCSDAHKQRWEERHQS